ncbi:LOW QUALITY PROTEIN: hypothetical protein Cgig2_015073 [Carnegiea gigantea]|uniref:Uncharacterized protein n=1 Tax=Carnegiea gigantea TaxID=171969 RepID=A0A9Q1GM60_9CARY|nr:LOW QUALITY PROTEIN: hypothetical protein Cgig2_015073 [Carnegiea gigantea]
MLHLLVCFGNKIKFKSLKVDFLVADVPTAYNVIIGRPTLHRRDGDYTSGYPPSSCSSFSDAPASASKGLVASSPAASPSDEGGINSTSSGVNTTLRRYPRASERPCWWPSPISPLQLPALRDSLHPSGEDLSHNYLLLKHLGRSEAPGDAKSQDLTMSWTRKSRTPGSALMKLAEGRGVIEEALLATRVTAPAVFEGVWCPYLGSVPLTTGSPIGERPAGWLSPPPPVMGQKPRSRQVVARSSASFESAGSQRASFRRV